ncbi:MAG: hypothetical protein ACI4L9_05985, partial [Candidatus Coproplasma sp.]
MEKMTMSLNCLSANKLLASSNVFSEILRFATSGYAIIVYVIILLVILALVVANVLVRDVKGPKRVSGVEFVAPGNLTQVSGQPQSGKSVQTINQASLSQASPDRTA